MRQWFRRPAIIIAIILIVILAQFAFINPVRDVVRRTIAVPTHFFDYIYLSVRGDFHTLNQAAKLSIENASLQNQILILQAQVSSLQSVKNEDTQLRKDLGFANAHPELKLTPANVISVSGVVSGSTLTIDKGSWDGLATGQAVVSSGYLIGKLGAVSNSTAEVMLLINRDVQVPVIFNTSQTTGLLSGGVSGLVVGEVPIDASVVAGETVATTNIEGVFPAGIPIGQVENIISQKQDIFLSARLTSPINLSSLSQVFVASTK